MNADIVVVGLANFARRRVRTDCSDLAVFVDCEEIEERWPDDTEVPRWPDCTEERWPSEACELEIVERPLICS